MDLDDMRALAEAEDALLAGTATSGACNIKAGQDPKEGTMGTPRYETGKRTPGGPGTPAYHNGDVGTAERVRLAILANRLKGAVRGFGHAGPAEGIASREDLDRLEEWIFAEREALDAEARRSPAEPDVTDGPCVVTFTWGHGAETKTYAALRIPAGSSAGMWQAHGYTVPAMAWEELVAWVAAGAPQGRPVEIHVSTGWTRI
jgi:hypothetical protein